jgi:hypothetical protein
MTTRTRRGTIALPAALAALAVSMALVATVTDAVRTEVTVAAERRTAARALDALDTCLSAVLAGLPAGWDFVAVLDGPDGIAATADDGTLATSPGCTGRARPAPGGPASPRLLVGLDAAAGNGRRLLDAAVGRSTEPMLPALVWTVALPDPAGLTGTVGLDGTGLAPGQDLPGLASPEAPAALDAWMAGVMTQVDTSPRTLPPVTALAPPLAEFLSRLRAAGAGGAALDPDPGPPAAASVALVDGDLLVGDGRQGGGILFVSGRLDIRGALTFTGVVIAAGGVRVADGAALAVAGGLWIGTTALPGGALEVAGTVGVRQDAAAIDAADALFPLPRRPVLRGLRDAA